MFIGLNDVGLFMVKVMVFVGSEFVINGEVNFIGKFVFMGFNV